MAAPMTVPRAASSLSSSSAFRAPVVSSSRSIPGSKLERNIEIIKFVSEGNTYQEAADRFNLSKQRISQILTKHYRLTGQFKRFQPHSNLYRFLPIFRFLLGWNSSKAASEFNIPISSLSKLETLSHIPTLKRERAIARVILSHKDRIIESVKLVIITIAELEDKYGEKE